MKFDPTGICILSSIKSKEECDAYLTFLIADERPRHLAAQQRDEMMAEIWRKYGGDYYLARAAFAESAAHRHQDDLDGIAKRIKEIEAYRETLK